MKTETGHETQIAKDLAEYITTYRPDADEIEKLFKEHLIAYRWHVIERAKSIMSTAIYEANKENETPIKTP